MVKGDTKFLSFCDNNLVFTIHIFGLRLRVFRFFLRQIFGKVFGLFFCCLCFLWHILCVSLRNDFRHCLIRIRHCISGLFDKGIQAIRHSWLIFILSIGCVFLI